MAEASDTPSATPAQRENSPRMQLIDRFELVAEQIDRIKWLSYAVDFIGGHYFHGGHPMSYKEHEPIVCLSEMNLKEVESLLDAFSDLQCEMVDRFAPFDAQAEGIR